MQDCNLATDSVSVCMSVTSWYKMRQN